MGRGLVDQGCMYNHRYYDNGVDPNLSPDSEQLQELSLLKFNRRGSEDLQASVWMLDSESGNVHESGREATHN